MRRSFLREGVGAFVYVWLVFAGASTAGGLGVASAFGRAAGVPSASQLVEKAGADAVASGSVEVDTVARHGGGLSRRSRVSRKVTAGPRRSRFPMA